MAGSYQAEIRPKPKHRAATYAIKEMVPVAIASVADAEAPVVIEYDTREAFRDETVRLREYRGRFYLQHDRMTLERFLDTCRNGDYASPFLRKNDAKTIEEWNATPGATILSTARDGLMDAMDAIANDQLVVDDLVYRMVPEPMLILDIRSNPTHIVGRISIAPRESRYGAFRLDDVETMRDAMRRYSDLTGIGDVREGFETLEMATGTTLSFDERDAAASDLADLGRATMNNRNLQYFSDDLIQAFLDLRKLLSRPREHVEDRYAAAMDAVHRALGEIPALPDRVLDESDWLHRTLLLASSAHAARSERDANLSVQDLAAFRI